MKTFILEKPSRIAKHKKALEKKLHIKIYIQGRKIDLLGEELEEYTASRVVEALDANFPLNIALTLVDEDILLEHLHIKDISRRTHLWEVRARVIGTRGRTLELIGELSDTYATIHNNIVSVIGPAEKIELALHAFTSLIRGSKQSSVYSYLEKLRKKKFDDVIEFKDEK